MRLKAGKVFTVSVRGMKMTPEKIEVYSKNRNDETYKDYPYKVTVPIGEVGNQVIVDAEGFIIPWPTSTTVINGVRPWDDKRYYYPIPLNEMLMNPELKQNPGWKVINRKPINITQDDEKKYIFLSRTVFIRSTVYGVQR